MPNIVAVLRTEITRLARKETRIHTKNLQRASAQYRRAVAALKRDVAQLRAEVARLKRSAANARGPQAGKEEGARIRFTAKGLKSQRARIGLSALDYGKLIGVTGHTVYSWENGASKPRAAQLASIAALRGIGKREALGRLHPPSRKPVPAAPKRRARARKR